MDAAIVLGQQGRLMIPAEVRVALLVPQQDAVAQLRALAVNVPTSRSFVEELIADRRRAAASE